MSCDTLLGNFFRISGMFLWAALLVVLYIIYRQKELINATLTAKRMTDGLLRQRNKKMP